MLSLSLWLSLYLTHISIHIYMYIYIYITYLQLSIRIQSKLQGTRGEMSHRWQQQMQKHSPHDKHMRTSHTVQAYQKLQPSYQHVWICTVRRYNIYRHTYNGDCTIQCIPKSESNYHIKCHINVNITWRRLLLSIIHVHKTTHNSQQQPQTKKQGGRSYIYNITHWINNKHATKAKQPHAV